MIKHDQNNCRLSKKFKLTGPLLSNLFPIS